VTSLVRFHVTGTMCLMVGANVYVGLCCVSKAIETWKKL
jgi:hypothetical protein